MVPLMDVLFDDMGLYVHLDMQNELKSYFKLWRAHSQKVSSINFRQN